MAGNNQRNGSYLSAGVSSLMAMYQVGIGVMK
jgi:hypothetical protein